MKNLSKIGLLSLASAMALGTSAPAYAGPEAYIGDITMMGSNFCPRGTAKADGQLVAISSNTALFSLIGTTYGGDGRTTFQLPDLRSRITMHVGNGAGLASRRLGERLGSETNTLSAQQLPAHTHGIKLNVSRVNANLRNPVDAYFARSANQTFESGTALQGDQMHDGTVTDNSVGGGQPVNNMQPTEVIQFCIVTQGIFPSRN